MIALDATYHHQNTHYSLDLKNHSEETCITEIVQFSIVTAKKHLHCMYQSGNIQKKKKSNFIGIYDSLFHSRFPDLNKSHSAVHLTLKYKSHLVKHILVSPVVEKLRQVSQ